MMSFITETAITCIVAVTGTFHGISVDHGSWSRITATAAAEAAQRREAEQAYRNKLMTGYGNLTIESNGVTLPAIKNGI